MTHYLSPPFWGGGADPEVRLWVPFDGNASTDISSYANGAGTATNATISSNQFTQVTGATIQKIVWGPSTNFGRTHGQPWTLEAFMTWTSSDNAVDPGGDLEYMIGTYGYRLHLYGNLGKVALDTADFGTPDAGPSVSNVLSGTGKTHVAMVHGASDPMRCYVGGVQVFTYTEIAPPSTTTGTVSIGNLQGAFNGVVSIDDVRLTFRELYTGTSFTPPTSPLS